MKRLFCFIIIAIICFLVFFIGASNPSAIISPKNTYTIVLDAGHGGRDDGVSGVSGTKESEINLSVTKKLQDLLNNFNFNVVLTRENESGLYEENVDNYKKSDMAKRKEIIENANADFVVSIHQNSYPNIHAVGAQVFCLEKNTESEILANAIQNQFIKLLPNARESISYGDYYMLKCIDSPSVIVECGYLTNPEEESMLKTDEYQVKIAYAITCGLAKYFNVVNDD